MQQEYEPLLQPVEITSLRPTQMTIGMREVAKKRAEWKTIAQSKGREFLGHHMIPAIRGPRDRLYIIDNHHLARALHEEGVEEVLVSVLADLSGLPKPRFWTFMDCRNWLHPYDAKGERRAYRDLPKEITELVDDPFRSLAGELRESGGYAKDDTPYSEFLWADFLRQRITVDEVKDNFDKALRRSLDLGHQKDASYLPGWCGPDGPTR